MPNGTEKNLKQSISPADNKLECNKTIINDRKNAKHGEFFFAEFVVSNGEKRTSPVFVLSNDNDQEDLIICSCTTKPAKTNYDFPYKLKYDTFIRINKIYTIHRDMLHFKIGEIDSKSDDYKNLIGLLKTALKLD